MRDGSYVIVDRLCEATTQLLEIIKKQEEIIELFTVYRNALLVQILLQQITLVVVDKRCGAARHRAFNGLANETAVAYLRE